MFGFHAGDKIGPHLDGNPQFARLLAESVGDQFQRGDWERLSIAEAMGRLAPEQRERLEDVLGGESVDAAPRAMTAQQRATVTEHSGELRNADLRALLAAHGPQAMKMMAAGDCAGARRLFREVGVPTKIGGVLLAGWSSKMVAADLKDSPACVVVVEALPNMTYVGRIVSINDLVVLQEIEPGQLVEHQRKSLGSVPEGITSPGKDARHATDGPWKRSWAIAYQNGKTSIAAADLTLLNGYSETPKPFTGRIVGDTERRYVQENEVGVYSGHLRSLTGELKVGESYELTYSGPAGEKSVDVRQIDRPAKVVNAAVSKSEPPVDDKRSLWYAPSSAAGMKTADLVNIIGAIYQRHEKVVAPSDLAGCLDRRRGNESFYGRILEVNADAGLVIQSIGLRQATAHMLEDFQEPPMVGVHAEVKYRDGKFSIVQERGQGRIF